MFHGNRSSAKICGMWVSGRVMSKLDIRNALRIFIFTAAVSTLTCIETLSATKVTGKPRAVTNGSEKCFSVWCCRAEGNDTCFRGYIATWGDTVMNFDVQGCLWRKVLDEFCATGDVRNISIRSDRLRLFDNVLNYNIKANNLSVGLNIGVGRVIIFVTSVNTSCVGDARVSTRGRVLLRRWKNPDMRLSLAYSVVVLPALAIVRSSTMRPRNNVILMSLGPFAENYSLPNLTMAVPYTSDDGGWVTEHDNRNNKFYIARGFSGRRRMAEGGKTCTLRYVSSLHPDNFRYDVLLMDYIAYVLPAFSLMVVAFIIMMFVLVGSARYVCLISSAKRDRIRRRIGSIAKSLSFRR